MVYYSILWYFMIYYSIFKHYNPNAEPDEEAFRALTSDERLRQKELRKLAIFTGWTTTTLLVIRGSEGGNVGIGK